MAEFTNGAYEPGTYTKGDRAVVAKTPAEAVKLVWNGFVRQADSEPEEAEGAPAADTVVGTEKVVGESAPEAKRGPGRPRKDAEDAK